MGKVSLGNRGLNEEDVQGYVTNGWHFRVKKVKGRSYITRRRGQEERGMGPFNPDFWATITRMIPQTAEEEAPSIREEPALERDVGDLPDITPYLARAEESEMKWRRLLKELTFHRSAEMARTCVHIDDECFCSNWSWEDKPEFFRLMDELMRRRVYAKKRIFREGLAIERWLVKADRWYCSSCPVYQPCPLPSETSNQKAATQTKG